MTVYFEDELQDALTDEDFRSEYDALEEEFSLFGCGYGDALSG